MRLFKRLFHLRVHLTLLNLYLFLSQSSETHSGEFIAGHMNQHQHHAFQFWLQTNSTVQFGVPTADQPQASLVDLKKSFVFLALEVILFISHCLIPSTL